MMQLKILHSIWLAVFVVCIAGTSSVGRTKQHSDSTEEAYYSEIIPLKRDLEHDGIWQPVLYDYTYVVNPKETGIEKHHDFILHIKHKGGGNSEIEYPEVLSQDEMSVHSYLGVAEYSSGSGFAEDKGIALQLQKLNSAVSESVLINSGMPGMVWGPAISVEKPEKPWPSNISIFVNSTSKRIRSVTKLCGLPPYIDIKACIKWNKTRQALGNCESKGRKVIFMAVVCVCGLVTVIGNSLFPLVLIQVRSYRNRHNYIKGSLAMVDMITGLYLLCCVIPNAVWMGDLTREELIDYVISSKNTSKSIIFGSLILLTTQLSILHLMFLAIERFIAIKWPFRHLLFGQRSVVVCLVAFWVFSIFEACLPVISHHHFQYQFHSLLLVYFLVVKHLYDGLELHGTLAAVVTLGLPYLITISLTLTTALIAWKQLRLSNILGSDSSSKSSTNRTSVAQAHSNKNQLTKDIALLKTTSIIILTFSLSLVPFLVVGYGLSFEYEDCSSHSLAYFVAFYLKMGNSLSNVIVYSVRDKKFRKAVKKMFLSLKYGNRDRRSSALSF